MKAKTAKNSGAGSRRNSHSNPRWKSRLLNVAILLGTAVVAVFVFSVAGRLSYSHAEKSDRPPRVLRTQVLNGCGMPGVAALFSEQLVRSQVGEFRFDVINRDNFDRFDVENSFLTVYTLSPDEALQLAQALGLSSEDVFMAERTDNPWGLDVSIVLGKKTTPVLPPAGVTSGTRSDTP